jgi:hypothetical protein
MRGAGKENEPPNGKSVQFFVQLYVILFSFGAMFRLVWRFAANGELIVDFERTRARLLFSAFNSHANLKVGATGCFRRHVQMREPCAARVLRRMRGRKSVTLLEGPQAFCRMARICRALLQANR